LSGYRKVQNICGQINWRTDLRRGILWAENCPNFLAGTSPDKVGYFNYGPEKLQGVQGNNIGSKIKDFTENSFVLTVEGHFL
jgi:hypothetical protein